MVAEYQTTTHTDWQRVSPRCPCPICHPAGRPRGKQKGCLIAPDGDVVCLHVQSSEPATFGFGGWWHRTGTAGRPRTWSAHTPAPSTPRTPIADVSMRSRVNTRLLELLTLTDQDIAYLTGPACGHEREALAGRYGSLPRSVTRQRAIIATLVAEFGADVVRTIPGFEEKDGELRFHLPFGLFVAVRDLHGQILGYQVRTGNSQYMWFSGGNGPSVKDPVVPVHVARPRPGASRTKRVSIVESPKTANMLAERQGATVIGLAGQNNGDNARDTLRQLQDDEDVDAIVILLDAVKADDDTTDPSHNATEGYRQEIAAMAHALGLKVLIGRWDYEQGKGPDDCLLNGHTWRLEIYRPGPTAGRDRDGGDTTGDPASGATDGPPRSNVPTLDKARALSHEALARQHVKVAQQLYDANTYLYLIARVSKHAAVITPEDDPSAKRTRPVLTPTDRMCGVNAILGIHAAAKGALSTQPVPMYRAAIAAGGTSVGTASSSMAQLARVGMLQQAPEEDEEGRRLYALPAVMPGEIPAANVLAFDSHRRTKERLRPCATCGGTEFARTTRVHTVCKGCGHIVTDKTHTVTLSDHDNDAAGDAAAAGMEPTTHTPPVANCNTYVPATDSAPPDEGDRYRDLGVAICNDPPSTPTAPRGRAAVAPFGARRQARIGDRAAARGHRASDDRLPRPADGCADDLEWNDVRASALLEALYRRLGDVSADAALPLPTFDDAQIDAAEGACDWPALVAAVDAAERGYRAALRVADARVPV